MRRHEIPQEQWDRIENLLPGRRGGHGGVAEDNRLLINAVWYLAKTGVPWRDLPGRFGLWNTAFQRFNRWCKKGVFQKVLAALEDPDLEWLMMDSTVIRAHQHAAGLNTEENPEDLGRSRGGFGTKIHLSVNSLRKSPGKPPESGSGRRLRLRGQVVGGIRTGGGVGG